MDILIPDQNKIIDIYGDRWHANPNKYKETDMIKLYRGLVSAKEIRERDHYRIKQLESFNFPVLIIWEDEINNDLENVSNNLNEYCKN